MDESIADSLELHLAAYNLERLVGMCVITRSVSYEKKKGSRSGPEGENVFSPKRGKTRIEVSRRKLFGIVAYATQPRQHSHFIRGWSLSLTGRRLCSQAAAPSLLCR
jgi:hypothetical protein